MQLLVGNEFHAWKMSAPPLSLVIIKRVLCKLDKYDTSNSSLEQLLLASTSQCYDTNKPKNSKELSMLKRPTHSLVIEEYMAIPHEVIFPARVKSFS